MDYLVPVSDDDVKALDITGLASDSREVECGSLFVAIAGYKSDGHEFIEQAVKNGASALVVEKDVGDQPIPVFRVHNTRKILAELAYRFYGFPSHDLEIIGITGTNGKTTVSLLLESILKTAGKQVGLIGTLMYRWKGYQVSAVRTTPESTHLHSMLLKMKEAGVKSVVIEVSSHALALYRVHCLQFRGAIFTNLSRDHMDFHHSPESYKEAKAILFQNIQSEGIGVINGDDPAAPAMIKGCEGKTVTYGLNASSDYQIDDIQTGNSNVSFKIHFEGKYVQITTPLWGRFNVMNCAAAAVMALELGVSDKDICQGISEVSRIPGRMERFTSDMGFQVIVDYAHTPDALINLLSAVREFTSGSVIVVFGCGGERDRGKRPEMGKAASQGADQIILTSDNPRREKPEAILLDILKGMKNMKGIKTIPDRREAIQTAINMAKKGDTVVLAGKGHETVQQIGKEKIPFDDREVVRRFLKIYKES
jgi:UDP-N-acetylmuramoyl-L-alanyl-D-glutamate--2,6-diaminopimelate ligase